MDRGAIRRRTACGKGVGAASRLFVAAVLGCIAVFATPRATGCGRDTECGEGGVCVHRTSRAPGVCYGLAHRQGDATTSALKRPAGMPADMKMPDQMLPAGASLEKPPGGCLVNQDCPPPQECYITLPPWGSCMTPP